VDGVRVRQKRFEQAESIAQKVQDLQSADPGVRLMVLGDFNAFEFSDGYVDGVGIIKGDFGPADNLVCDTNTCNDLVEPDLTNHVLSLLPEERYSFIFRGNAQVLDHALSSQALADEVAGAEYGRGNADAAVDLINDDIFPQNTPLRASDHDGLVVYILKDKDLDGVPNHLDACPDAAGPADNEGCPLVAVDIKPGSCPNSYNRNSRGVLPVAVVGTANLGVGQIDPASVRLCLPGEDPAAPDAKCVAPHEGPPGPRTVVEDVATPFVPEDSLVCDCHELGGDGIADLSMKFKTEELVPALELDDRASGDLVELVVRGTLVDGTPFAGSDCVRLVPPGTPPNLLQVWPNATGAWIEVGPLDDQLDGGGFGVFQRTYPQDTEAVLTADPEMDGRAFLGWRADGGRLLQTQTMTLKVNGHIQTVEAVYEDAPARRCGLGYELALLVPPLLWLRARRRRAI
jgi:hypothetical protein